MAQMISTSLVYPRYEEHEGIADHFDIRGTMFRLFMRTHIRKQYEGVWYLIPIIMRSDNKLMPDKHEEWQKAQFRRDIEIQFHAECYKTLLFYKIDNTLRMQMLPDGHPMIFQDTDQRSEEERLIPKI